jgi:predicted enzyme related to lactoylglutathione lyase
MIKCVMTGKKLTPNQIAKELLADKMEVVLEFWEESFLVRTSEMTDKEKQKIKEQLVKRYNGVINYLGL